MSSRRPGTPRASSRPASDAKRRGGSTSRTSRGSARGGSTGPGRSAPAAPKIEPSSPQGSLASVLTWRTGVLVLVVILAFAVVAPAVRGYLDQQAMLEELRADAAVAQAEVDDLEAEVARWDDPAYLVAQARERLAYVFPGETPYRVVDPETIEDPEVQHADEVERQAAAGLEPWYDTLWDTMTEGAEPAAEESAEGSESGSTDEDSTTAEDEDEPLTDVDFGG